MAESSVLNLVVQLGASMKMVQYSGASYEQLQETVGKAVCEEDDEISHLELWNGSEFTVLDSADMESLKERSMLQVILNSNEAPLCGESPVVEPEGSPEAGPEGSAAAVISTDKVWKGRQKLSVYFLNPEWLRKWRCKGGSMSEMLIMGWAKRWCDVTRPEIPEFHHTELVDNADIRVKFSDTSGCWSMVGTDAELITDKNKPTMTLNLGRKRPALQESLVVHEFGHALGLEHEHQRSDFWDEMEKYLDIDKMKSDPRVSGDTGQTGSQSFGAHFFKKTGPTVSKDNLPEYDPESIMHYTFHLDWLKDDYQDFKDVSKVDASANLTPRAKKYLKGIHTRHKKRALQQLPPTPSLGDFKTLLEAYNGHVPTPPPPTPSPIGKILSVNSHLKHFRNALWEARAAWRDIGMELNVGQGDLDAFEVDTRFDQRLTKVLTTWMHSNKATTQQLLDALEVPAISRKDLADKIRAGDKVNFGLD